MARIEQVTSMLRAQESADGASRMQGTEPFITGQGPAAVSGPAYDGGSLEEFLGDTQGYELAARVESVYDRWLRHRQGREKQWFEALAYFRGRQSNVWDAARHVLKTETRRASWSRRRTINKIKPIVEHVRAILTRGQTRMSCFAGSSEGEDALASRSSEAAIEHYRRRTRFGKLWRATVLLKTITGTAAHECEWDHLAGARVKNEIPMGMNPDGSPVFGPSRVGKHVIHQLTPFNLVPDPKANGDFNGEGLFTIREESPRWLAERYPHAAGWLSSESLAGKDMGLHYLIQFQEMATRFGWASGGYENRDSLVQKTLYLPKSVRWPRGRRIIVANYTLLAGDAPEDINDVNPVDEFHGEGFQPWPVFIYRHVWDGVSFFGDGVVPELIDLQNIINEMFSKGESIVHTMANPKWIALKVNELKITDKPGEVIRVPTQYDPSRAVRVERGADLPVSLPNFIALCENEMREIAGIREATMGEAPSARSSGVQLDRLIGQDAQRLRPVREDDEETLEDEWSYLLTQVQRNVPMEHIVRVAGGHETAALMFKSSDLVEGIDVKVMPDARLPYDPEARATVLSLLSQGRFLQPDVNPKHSQLGLDLMDLGNVRRFRDDLHADEEKADRENLLMERGLPPIPEDIDNHLTHFLNHASFEKTERFERLPLMAKMSHRAHTEWHMLKVLEALRSGTMQVLDGATVPADPMAGTSPAEDGSAPAGGQPAGMPAAQPAMQGGV